jgi:hypothetical protein
MKGRLRKAKSELRNLRNILPCKLKLEVTSYVGGLMNPEKMGRKIVKSKLWKIRRTRKR